MATTTSDEQPHIGNYRLLKTIGKGNFAKVKLARHVLTGKEVGMSARAHTHTHRLDWTVRFNLILRFHLQSRSDFVNLAFIFSCFDHIQEKCSSIDSLFNQKQAHQCFNNKQAMLGKLLRHAVML